MGTDDDREAALIDSFFLPGGLFADDEDAKNIEYPCVDAISNLSRDAMYGKSTTIPSNPWQALATNIHKRESPDRTSNYALSTSSNRLNSFRESVERTQEQHDHSYLQSSFLPVDTDANTATTTPISEFGMYNEKDREIPLESLFVCHRGDSLADGNHFLQSSATHINFTQAVIRPPPGFQHSRPQPPPLPNFDYSIIQHCTKEKTIAIHSTEKKANDQHHVVTPIEEKNRQQRRVNHPLSIVSSAESRYRGEECNVLTEQNISKRSIQFHNDKFVEREDAENTHDDDNTDDYEDDDDDDENDDEEDDVDDNDANEDEDADYPNVSIPLFIYDLCKTESNTCSSLSTSSDFDISDDDDVSRASQTELLNDGGVGYDTDQAHVSIIRDIHDGIDLEIENDGKSISTTPSAMYSGEKPMTSLSDAHDQAQQPQSAATLTPLWKPFVAFLILLIQNATHFFQSCDISVRSGFQKSVLCNVITRQGTSMRRRLEDISEKVTTLNKSAVGLRDVLYSLATQLLCKCRRLLFIAANCLILSASFVFQACKYSLLESIEEPGVTTCYLIFYFMPSFCCIVMNHTDLPHWSPHLITCLSVFGLCNQLQPSTLRDHDVSKLRLSTTTTDDKVSTTKEKESSLVSTTFEGHRGSVQQVLRRLSRDERACRAILRILRFMLPVFFVADGFSSEFGTIMGVTGAGRLTTAFMMSLVRQNLVSSPIGWVSWALQVLAATYFSNWVLLDALVLVLGMSSVRLIRYIDFHRLDRGSRAR